VLNRLTPRLIFSHLLVIAVAMALLGFLLLSLVQGYFEQAVRDGLLVQARLVARGLTASPPLGMSNVQQALLPPASNAVQQQAQNRPAGTTGVPAAATAFGLDAATLQITSQLATRVRLVDGAGLVMADSQGTAAGEDLGADPLVAAALQGREGSHAAAGLMSVAVPLSRDGSAAGAVYLSQPLSDLAAVLADLRGRLAISAAVALVLSALVGLVLSRAIARPVRELTVAADRLAGGDFAYPLTTTSTEELAGLAASFGSMRDELRRTLQARTDLVSNVSHELRTPLTAIKGLTETLRDGAVDDLDARDRFLASIEGQTDRLIRLVNDLLLLSRADSQALGLRLERVDLCEVASSSAGELALQAEARDVSIEVVGEPAIVSGDPDRLRQVLINLLDNALRYSPEGGAVAVRVAREGDHVLVTVHDDGPGIPAGDLPHVFERFYRGDRSRSRHPQPGHPRRGAEDGAGGSGLGLAIVQALIHAHGGAIAVDSAPDKGTTVRFSLPAA
jgi:signal transduction histidine kinase